MAGTAPHIGRPLHIGHRCVMVATVGNLPAVDCPHAVCITPAILTADLTRSCVLPMSGMGRTHGQTLSRKSTPAATSIADRQCTCKWLLTASLPPILSRLTPRRVAWRLLAASRPVATDLVGIPCLFWARTISHSGEALRHRYLHGSRWPEGPAAPHEATRAEGREAAVFLFS